MSLSEENVSVIAGGPERNGEEANMVEVTEGEQGKIIKMEDETKKLSQLLTTHLGLVEVARQPCRDQ